MASFDITRPAVPPIGRWSFFRKEAALNTVEAVKFVRMIDKALETATNHSRDKAMKFLDELHAAGYQIERIETPLLAGLEDHIEYRNGQINNLNHMQSLGLPGGLIGASPFANAYNGPGGTGTSTAYDCQSDVPLTKKEAQKKYGGEIL